MGREYQTSITTPILNVRSYFQWDLGCGFECIPAKIPHCARTATRYCDSAVLMNNGKISSIGNSESVLTGERLKKVFGVDKIVKRHPITDSLYVAPISISESRITQPKKPDSSHDMWAWNWITTDTVTIGSELWRNHRRARESKGAITVERCKEALSIIMGAHGFSFFERF